MLKVAILQSTFNRDSPLDNSIAMASQHDLLTNAVSGCCGHWSDFNEAISVKRFHHHAGSESLLQYFFVPLQRGLLLVKHIVRKNYHSDQQQSRIFTAVKSGSHFRIVLRVLFWVSNLPNGTPSTLPLPNSRALFKSLSSSLCMSSLF